MELRGSQSAYQMLASALCHVRPPVAGAPLVCLPGHCALMTADSPPWCNYQPDQLIAQPVTDSGHVTCPLPSGLCHHVMRNTWQKPRQLPWQAPREHGPCPAEWWATHQSAEQSGHRLNDPRLVTGNVSTVRHGQTRVHNCRARVSGHGLQRCHGVDRHSSAQHGRLRRFS